MQDSWEKTEIIYISWNCEKLLFKHTMITMIRLQVIEKPT